MRGISLAGGIAAAALIALIPAYWVALHHPAVGTFHDDGVYLVTAKALATGHGYRIISLPDEIPQTKYPILFPLALSAVWRLDAGFPSNVLLLKLVPFCFGLVWFYLIYRLMAMEASRDTALFCTALSASMVWSVYLSTTLLSETMFASLCMGCLLLLRRAEIAGSAGREWLPAAILAGLACVTRTAGVCALAAGAIYYLRQRRAGTAARYLLVAMAVCAPWFWWVKLQPAPATDAYYSAANYASWNVFSHTFDLHQKMAIVFLNALYALRSPLTVAGTRLPWLVEVLASLALLMAALRWVRRMTVVEIFLGVYLAMTLAWAWPPDRFLVVVYPLMLCLAWRIWRAAIERFAGQAHLLRRAGWTLAGLTLASGLWTLNAWTQATLDPAKGKGMVLQDPWAETSAQLTWIREQTPAGAVVLANLDPVFYLYTGRKAVRGFQADPYQLFYMTAKDAEPLGTVDEFRETIRREKVEYLVRAPNHAFAEGPALDRLITELARREPDAVRLVAQGNDARYQIYRVDGLGR